MRPRLVVPLTVFLVLGQVEVAAAASVDLVKNGGFESELSDWNTVTLSQFYPADALFLADGIAYSGSRSLRVAAIVAYEPQVRGEIYQIIQDPRLSLDSTFSFWVYPMVAADDMLTAHIWLYLVLQTTSQRQYRLAYHVAWETVAWPGYRDWQGNTSDTTDFFIRTSRSEWNYIQRDLRRDLESRFGLGAGVGLSKMEIHIATSTRQPIAPYRLATGFVWWDDIKLLSTPPPRLDVSLTAYRSGIATREALVGEEVQLVASLFNPSDTPVRDLVAEAVYPNGLRVLSKTSAPSYLDAGSRAQIAWTIVADAAGNYTLSVKLSSSAGTYSGQVSMSAKSVPSQAPQVVPPGEQPPAGPYFLIIAVVAAAFAAGVLVSTRRQRGKRPSK